MPFFVSPSVFDERRESPNNRFQLTQTQFKLFFLARKVFFLSLNDQCLFDIDQSDFSSFRSFLVDQLHHFFCFSCLDNFHLNSFFNLRISDIDCSFSLSPSTLTKPGSRRASHNSDLLNEPLIDGRAFKIASVQLTAA